VGQRGIDHLKSRNAGRATFLPLTEMDDRSLPAPPDHPGVVDFAYELVEFDSRYAGVFSYVLGDTLVVEDVDTARELMGRHRLVTLDGDLVEKSGAMTGGSGGGTRYSFAGGTSRLERVADRITDLEERRRERRQALRDVEERLDDAREKATDAAERVRDVEAELDEAREELETLEDRIEAERERLAEIEAEREDVADRMEALEADIEDKSDEIEAREREAQTLEEELRSSEVAELTERAEALREAIDEVDAEMADLDGRLNELGLEKEYAEETIEELHERIETAQTRKTEAEDRIEALEADLADQRELKAEKEARIEALEDELADLKTEREELNAELSEAREARDGAEEAVAEVEARLESRREEADRLEWEIEELADEVGDYDPEAVPDPHTVKSEIGRIESAMEALEPVNMLAIEEYDRVAEELVDLETKRATLVEEREGIEERIAEYESRKKATFMEAYEGINEQFERIFERLSDGSGTLHLEDPADPFEGGLTMKAQPGDKPVQRLDAMSGGEKSLTALAFIFAIQRYNPAPFYALDEIDAFLDAANAEAVGDLIDDLAGEAQFVVVSHRSAMLDRSERAIGVTMREDNVSAVTGIDLSGDAADGDADGEEAPADD